MPPGAPKNVAPGAPTVPHPNQLMILIRSTLLAVNHANLTGNYTVLRELGTLGFQQTNNSAQLAEIFRELRNRNIDLGPIAVLDAKLVRERRSMPVVVSACRGYFPSRPEQVNFDLAFMMMGDRWRLHGIALTVGYQDSLQARKPRPMSIAQRSPTWKNEKHRKQWASTLEQYAYKSLGSRRAASIDAKLINDTLAHIWTTKQETASRVKQRIERIQWVKDGMPLPQR